MEFGSQDATKACLIPTEQFIHCYSWRIIACMRRETTWETMQLTMFASFYIQTRIGAELYTRKIERRNRQLYP